MAKHLLEWSATARLITVRPVGFWSKADFDAYRAEILSMINRVGAPFDIMTDMTQRIPQGAEVATLFDELAGTIATLGLRHFVVVGVTPLLGMQVKRITKVASPHFVGSVAEGREWLKGQSSTISDRVHDP